MQCYKTIIILFLLFTPPLVNAVTSGNPVAGTQEGAPPVTLNNPLGKAVTDGGINFLVGQLINGVLGVVGSLALVMFIYGGFTWMFAAGDSGKVKKGRDIILWSVIGLVVIFSAYAMVNFVLQGIAGTAKG